MGPFPFVPGSSTSSTFTGFLEGTQRKFLLPESYLHVCLFQDWRIKTQERLPFKVSFVLFYFVYEDTLNSFQTSSPQGDELLSKCRGRTVVVGDRRKPTDVEDVE